MAFDCTLNQNIRLLAGSTDCFQGEVAPDDDDDDDGGAEGGGTCMVRAKSAGMSHVVSLVIVLNQKGRPWWYDICQLSGLDPDVNGTAPGIGSELEGIYKLQKTH